MSNRVFDSEAGCGVVMVLSVCILGLIYATPSIIRIIEAIKK